MTGPGLFADVDRALVMAALADRLRQAGVPVSATATVRACQALEAVGPPALDDLYWATRLSFVAHRRHLPVFDELFDAVFDTDHRGRDWARRAMRANSAGAPRPGEQQHSVRLTADDHAVDGGGMPWATLPSIRPDDGDEGDDDTDLRLAERAPSATTVDQAKPFDLLDEAEMVAVGQLLEAAMDRWPHRRSRRHRSSDRGRRPDLRTTLARARRTAGEPMVIAADRPRQRPRPLVVFLDVSGSMEAFARAYLHVARPLARAGRAEVFAFATDATRITAALRLRSPVEAIERASDEVGDRFGGTRLATSLRTVVGHRSWGSLVRGSVVLIVSDGWDTDPAADLDRVMGRLQRMSHRLVWVNPRLAADGFEPRAAGMAAALPHCDRFLPGHHLAAMADVLADLHT
ncbi:MAG: VWA domain-containing protein [Actinomycetota bacterium]